MKKNNKLVKVLLASSLLLPGIAPLASQTVNAAPTEYAVGYDKETVVAAMDLVVRHMPRLNASPAEDIDFIERGDVMSFVEVVDNTWFKVSVDGTEGYVLRGDVTSQENFDSQDTKLQDIKADKEDGMEEEYTVAVTTALRTGDADRYRPLKTLRRTNVVTYLGTTANGWFKVKDAEGTEGFVNRTEVTKNENMDGNNPVEKAIEMELDEDQELDVVLNSSIRTQPGNQYAILDELERNEVVTYKGTALQGNKQWFKVELTDGSWGYVDRGHVTKAPEVEDLVVSSVSAINQTIADEKTELAFLVNDEEVLTAAEFDEKYGEEGYDVNFLYNFYVEADGPERGGTVTRDAGKNFKYAVQVIDEEGDKLPETVAAKDYADVTVVAAGKAVEVTELGLYEASDDKFETELDYVAVGDEDVVIAATKALDKLGKETKGLPEVSKVTSDNVNVAYYDEEVIARKAGEVTFTVTFAGIEETYDITVDVREERKADSIANDDVRVQNSKTYELPDIEVLDQYGEEFEVEEKDLDIKVTDAKNNEVEADTGKYDLSKEGFYTVTVSLGDNELGSFTVESVDVEKDIDEYKLVFADKDETKLDLVDGGLGSLDLTVEAYVDGIKVDLDDTKLEAKSSDKKVATVEEAVTDGKITVEAKAVGTTTISLYTVEGDLKVKVDELDVEVENTTLQIDNLELAEGVKTLDVVESDKETGWDIYNLEQLTTDVKDKDGKPVVLTEAMIDKVEFSKEDGKAIVTIAKIHGGEEFTFAAADQATVKDEIELDNALGDADVKNIVLAADIENATVKNNVETEVTIDGQNKYTLKNLDLGVDNVTFKNVTIAGEDENTGRAITLRYVDNITFDNVTFKDAMRGLQGDHLGNPTDLTVINSTFETKYGIAGTEKTGFAKIEGNTFKTSVSGVDIAGSAELGDLTDSAKIAKKIAIDNTDSKTGGKYVVDYGNGSQEYNQAGKTVADPVD